MIGHDDNDEEVHYKVADKRKFNSDGSLREGVTLDAEPVRTPAPAVETAAQPQSPIEETGADPTDEDAESSAATDGEDIPGADDPASFVNFLSTLATNAAASLGAVPHPATGKRSLDLDTGKYWLDLLAMIRYKT